MGVYRRKNKAGDYYGPWIIQYASGVAILDQRYEAMLPVILTTNIMDIKSLETCLGDKIIDRLYEGESKIFRFDWHSYRKFQRNEQ